jgi:hypothetical protein
LGETVIVKLVDWRTTLVHYLENPGQVIDIIVRQQALMYVLLDHDLYR